MTVPGIVTSTSKDIGVLFRDTPEKHGGGGSRTRRTDSFPPPDTTTVGVGISRP